MATHSSILTWRTPGTAEPDGLPSMGSHRVGHDRSDLAAVTTTVKKQNKTKQDIDGFLESKLDVQVYL